MNWTSRALACVSVARISCLLMCWIWDKLEAAMEIIMKAMISFLVLNQEAHDYHPLRNNQISDSVNLS